MINNAGSGAGAWGDFFTTAGGSVDWDAFSGLFGGGNSGDTP